jgi:hypothetical protein
VADRTATTKAQEAALIASGAQRSIDALSHYFSEQVEDAIDNKTLVASTLVVASIVQKKRMSVSFPAIGAIATLNASTTDIGAQLTWSF